MNDSSISLSAMPAARSSERRAAGWLERRLQEVNRELWLVLSMFVLAAFLNFAAGTERMVLGFYSLPTLFSAYVYGRRHAVLSAFASAFLVGLLSYFNPQLFTRTSVRLPVDDRWFDLVIWAGILVLTAYAMGTLYERRERSMSELRDAYHGILLILQSVIAKDKDIENHSYRVSIYATRIAQIMRMEAERIEDLRSAALLHELVNVDIGHDVLLKAARSTGGTSLQSRGAARAGGSLPRVLPILLAAGEARQAGGSELPIESRVLSVADVFDSLTSDRPYRKAMSPFDAKEIILRGAGSDFDPTVVSAFAFAFDRRQLEPPAFTGTASG
ncbi:MAG TPA: HD domain-containing phosphohydrolase [Terriglobales bacterium]|nr:HD domain-containing phosphohydrolase [Terriglobales bacterium]